MKLIIFSDIHGNSYALKEFIRQIKAEQHDYLIFCGDIFGYYYNQKEIITELKNLDNLIWLKGNHDEYFLKLYAQEMDEQYYIQNYGHSYCNLIERFDKDEVQLIAGHPSENMITTEHGKIGIFHGTPENSLEGRLYPDNPILNLEAYKKYDIVILGHTHCRMVRKVGDTLVLNSGSLGQPRDGSGYGYAILNTESKEVEFKNIEFDQKLLYEQIEMYDNDLKKLNEVLERGK